jgi:hypothetical protein
MESPKIDFFISYNKVDCSWAEWVAWQLEEEKYTTVLQAWDFRPGANFVLEMQRATTQAERTVAILSHDYLAAHFTQSEWAAAFALDPTGEKNLLLPIRVQETEMTGILSQVIYVDLVGLGEQDARSRLLAGVRQTRLKPSVQPFFPGKLQGSSPNRPTFPPIQRLAQQVKEALARLHELSVQRERISLLLSGHIGVAVRTTQASLDRMMFELQEELKSKIGNSSLAPTGFFGHMRVKRMGQKAASICHKTIQDKFGEWQYQCFNNVLLPEMNQVRNTIGNEIESIIKEIPDENIIATLLPNLNIYNIAEEVHIDLRNIEEMRDTFFRMDDLYSDFSFTRLLLWIVAALVGISLYRLEERVKTKTLEIVNRELDKSKKDILKRAEKEVLKLLNNLSSQVLVGMETSIERVKGQLYEIQESIIQEELTS